MMAARFLFFVFVKKASGQFSAFNDKNKGRLGGKGEGCGSQEALEKKSFPYIAKELQFTAVFEFP